MKSETTIQQQLSSLATTQPQNLVWRPQLYSLALEADRASLAGLLASGQVHRVHDTLRRQLIELVDTREPSLELSASELEERVDMHLDGTPRCEYGVWVHYPWSNELVHVIPEDEFRELRTSRNRNKVTLDEQRRLSEIIVGVVGLSVGQATSITLVLEEVGGSLRLADFDHLDLSNLNRLRAGIQHLGLNKAVLTAREIFQINPFADVSIFPDGVTDENLNSFLLDDGKLDILIDECDDLAVKLRLRERARELGIPVLMETSDRGLIDVERFDLEPERPLFHGLTGDLRADQLRGLTTTEKVPTVMNIIGERTMSRRMAASMIDIGSHLKTWPQLASDVALGGALATNTVRRMALGQLNDSGRFYLDMESIVKDGSSKAEIKRESYDVEVSEESRKIVLPRLKPVRATLSRDDVRALVAYGMAAPSGGNCQPWKFHYRCGRLRCMHDVEASKNFLDFQHSASYLAFGCMAENIELAARAMGLESDVDVFPEPSDSTVVCDIHLKHHRGAIPDVDPLLGQISQRCTNRRLGLRVPLTESEQKAMDDSARARGMRLHWLKEDKQLDAIADILGRGDRLRLLSKVMHREMMAEIRWNAAEAERTRDGIDVATLEMTAADLAGLKLISHWNVMSVAGRLGGGAGLERPSRKAIASASAVGLLTTPGRTAKDFFAGGRGLQHIWLTATHEGLAFQPMTSLLYLFQRLEYGAAEDFDVHERRTLSQLRHAYRQLFDVDPEAGEVMLFRVSHAGPPTARALRRNVDGVLVAET